MAERVYCPSCQSMQVAGDIHSCFDAALHVRVKDAERAVIDAAKVYAEASTRNGAFALTDAERARPVLVSAVAALRALEGGS